MSSSDANPFIVAGRLLVHARAAFDARHRPGRMSVEFMQIGRTSQSLYLDLERSEMLRIADYFARLAGERSILERLARQIVREEINQRSSS